VIPRDESMRTRCLFCTAELSFSLSLCFEDVPLVSCLYTAAMVQGGKFCKEDRRNHFACLIVLQVN
jgi:hypothetical protein